MRKRTRSHKNASGPQQGAQTPQAIRIDRRPDVNAIQSKSSFALRRINVQSIALMEFQIRRVRGWTPHGDGFLTMFQHVGTQLDAQTTSRRSQDMCSQTRKITRPRTHVQKRLGARQIQRFQDEPVNVRCRNVNVSALQGLIRMCQVGVVLYM